MARTLKNDFRTATDATRFGGQFPTFYRDLTNFTGNLPLSNGGTGGTSALSARTSLDIYSKSEVDSKIATVNNPNGTYNIILNGNNNVTANPTNISVAISSNNVLVASSSGIEITGDLTVSGTIDGVVNVAGKADSAFSWGNHASVGYLTSVPNNALNQLTDVQIQVSPSAGQILVYNATAQKFEVGSISLSSNSINDLSDVDTVTSPASVGDLMKWNGNNWVPDKDLSNAVQTINDLNDVNTVNIVPINNSILSWSGSQWIPKNINSLISSSLTLTDLSVDFGEIS